jgi:hypothetical protein
MTDPGAANRRDGLYLAECFWPGAREQVLQRSPTRCLELILVPADEIALALYQAPSAWVMSAASRTAVLPSQRSMESQHPGGQHRGGPPPPRPNHRTKRRNPR